MRIHRIVKVSELELTAGEWGIPKHLGDIAIELNELFMDSVNGANSTFESVRDAMDKYCAGTGYKVFRSDFQLTLGSLLKKIYYTGDNR